MYVVKYYVHACTTPTITTYHVMDAVFFSNAVDIRIDEDEKNMLYVAITRAKKQVIVTRDIVRILSLASEHLMYCMCNKDGKRTEEEKVIQVNYTVYYSILHVCEYSGASTL